MHPILLGQSLRRGLRRALALDLDWRTGFGIEKVTITSTSGHSGTTGPRVLDYRKQFVAVPSGYPKGLRGVRVIQGSTVTATGWQTDPENSRPFYSLGGGWGISWYDPLGYAIRAGVVGQYGAYDDPVWWGPQPTTTEIARYTIAPGQWTVVYGARTAVTDSTCPLPSPHAFGPNAGAAQRGQLQTTTSAILIDGRVWCIAKADTASWLCIYSDVGYSGVYYDLQTGTIGTVQSAASSATITSLGQGWYLCGHKITGYTTEVRILCAAGDNASEWSTAAGTERIRVAYLGSSTRTDFGLVVETETASVPLTYETVAADFAPGAGDWTVMVTGPDLSEDPAGIPYARFVGTPVGAHYLSRSTGGSTALESLGSIGYAASSTNMLLPGTTTVACRRKDNVIVFRANNTLGYPSMATYDPTEINAQTTAHLAGYNNDSQYLGRTWRFRLWKRALTDEELLSA